LGSQRGAGQTRALKHPLVPLARGSLHQAQLAATEDQDQKTEPEMTGIRRISQGALRAGDDRVLTLC
jgi:hypothetical protein